MKSRPKYLPQDKQDALKRIVAAVRARVVGMTILAVTGDEDSERTVARDNAPKAELEAGHPTCVSLIVHTIRHVNQMPAERMRLVHGSEGLFAVRFGAVQLARPPKELAPAASEARTMLFGSRITPWAERADTVGNFR